MGRLTTDHHDRLLAGVTSFDDLLSGLPSDGSSVPRCHGFLCQGNPLPLAPLATPQFLSRADAWSQLIHGSLDDPDGRNRVEIDNSTPHSVDRNEQLARPPDDLRRCDSSSLSGNGPGRGSIGDSGAARATCWRCDDPPAWLASLQSALNSIGSCRLRLLSPGIGSRLR